MAAEEVYPADRPAGISRRRFLGYVIAAPTLVAGAQLGLGSVLRGAWAAAPVPGVSDLYDLTDMLTDAAGPTSHLITVVMNADGTASFALHRAEVGQGITTAVAMTIADELDMPVENVKITLADARPELLWNQLTGASNSMHAIFTPVRVAAAVARQQLLDAAAIELDADVARLTAYQGVITAPGGASVSYGSLAGKAAAQRTAAVPVQLKGDFTVVGRARSRIDARDIVTGHKKFAMDVVVPGALPTMVCRPPTINGTVVAVPNAAAVKAMPGVTDVVTIPTGVAVRAQTFGQCIDGVRALQVVWGPGTADGKSDATVLDELRAAESPLAPPPLPGATTMDHTFTFAFASNSPLETNCAVADVRADSAEIWASMKTPILAQESIAQAVGLSPSQVVCHVVEGGGSFGRHLFFDAPLEAALISKAMGKPVRLMWHRTDDFRQGRAHPMSVSHVQISYSGTDVLSYVQRHTSVATDWTHGLGEIVSATLAKPPQGNNGYSQTVFDFSQNMPYSFGSTVQQLQEADNGFNTGAMRNVYSPNVTTARELMVDQLAAAAGVDALALRQQLVKDARMRAVLDEVAQVGSWKRPMVAGTAQGIAIHSEYKSRCAVLVEIDCRPQTVNRSVVGGYTGPRVTKAVCVVDVGLPINPRGLEAQMMGGIMDGIGLALTFSVHLRDGHFLEGSWDDTFYTRQWNVPFDLQVIVMPATTDVPGGAGELAVAPSLAATASAYPRATGTVPTTFPINHNRTDLGFEPMPTVPSIPVEPTNGLSKTF